MSRLSDLSIRRGQEAVRAGRTDVDVAERLYAAGWLLREIGVELGFS